jgi:SPP1 family predicted phage head-tail adaptor
MIHFESLLNNEFSVARMARTSDGQGGWIEAPEVLGTVRGRMRPATGREREVAAQEQREISHVLYVLAGEDIARGDLVTGGGVTVEVQGIREPSLAGHHLEIDCQEIQTVPAAEAGS